MDGWMDGWIDGWMHGWMDGWMCVTSLLAQPPPSEWIRQGHPAHTPQQGPQAVGKGREKTERLEGQVHAAEAELQAMYTSCCL
eukprot:356120-Chlamydomonas_euryale.AAC.7